ncbi:hypothetical protein D030_0214B, partial [Vibrio parahaemolyticus AQ3810]
GMGCGMLASTSSQSCGNGCSIMVILNGSS